MCCCYISSYHPLRLVLHATVYSSLLPQVVDTARMSFADQLRLVRGTNILVGVHGAGLMFIMFAAEEV